MAASKGPEAYGIIEGGSVTLKLDGAEVTMPLDPRTFSSGSVGFYQQGKVQGSDGRRYQVGVTATLIGSKPVK